MELYNEYKLIVHVAVYNDMCLLFYDGSVLDICYDSYYNLAITIVAILWQSAVLIVQERTLKIVHLLCCKMF